MPNLSSDVENGSSEHDALLGGSSSNNHDSSIQSKMKNGVRSLGRIVWFVLASNYVNVLLVFVPLGIIAGLVGWSPTAIFILNFFAIIPLAALLSYATEEISLKVGQTMGGLFECNVWKCCRAYCEYQLLHLKSRENVIYRANTTWILGQYSRFTTESDQNCPSEYAW